MNPPPPSTHHDHYRGSDVDLVPGTLRGYRTWILTPGQSADYTVTTWGGVTYTLSGPPDSPSFKSIHLRGNVWMADQVNEAHCRSFDETKHHYDQAAVIDAWSMVLDSKAYFSGSSATITRGAYKPAPVSSCVCGFYAALNVQNIPQDCGRILRSGEVLPTSSSTFLLCEKFVLGSITAHGKIVLGTRGFRAQYASIEAVVSTVPIPGVITVGSLDELLARFPPADVSTLIGQGESRGPR